VEETRGESQEEFPQLFLLQLEEEIRITLEDMALTAQVLMEGTCGGTLFPDAEPNHQ
jgi:hypothetical protein